MIRTGVCPSCGGAGWYDSPVSKLDDKGMWVIEYPVCLVCDGEGRVPAEEDE